MFILKNKKQLERAISKAKKLRPSVKFIGFGQYRVSGSRDGTFYTVTCEKSKNGYKMIHCDCKGGENGFVCYHAVAALSLHIGLARQISEINSRAENVFPKLGGKSKTTTSII